jgi:hypothetical protein
MCGKKNINDDSAITAFKMYELCSFYAKCISDLCMKWILSFLLVTCSVTSAHACWSVSEMSNALREDCEGQLCPDEVFVRL